jgi:hypothetical protein
MSKLVEGKHVGEELTVPLLVWLHRYAGLEDKKELNTICGAFLDSLDKLREDVRKSNRCIATLEESNRILRNVLINTIVDCPRSPNHGTK